MRIKIRAHFRKKGKKRVSVKRHIRAFRKKKNIGEKASVRHFEVIPPIVISGRKIFHKKTKKIEDPKSNFSSLTVIGTASAILDEDEKRLKQKKIVEKRLIEAKPVTNLIEFFEKEEAKKKLAEDIFKQEAMLRSNRKRLKIFGP